MIMEQEPRIYSVTQARELLGGISHSHIYRLMESGRLPFMRSGRRRYMSRETIEAYIQAEHDATRDARIAAD